MIVLCRKQAQTTSPSPPIITTQSPTCRLLALPAEIRTIIWEFLLIQAHPDPSSPPSSYNNPPLPPSPRFCANILKTCRQIHAEGTPILYGANPFLAHPSLLASLPAFLLRIRPAPRAALAPVTAAHLVRLIRRYHVHVRLDTDPRFTRADAQEAFGGCDLLDIEVFQASYGTCDLAVLALFEGVRGVGLVRIWGSVGDGKYVGWLARRMMGKAVEGEVEGEGEEAEGGGRSWNGDGPRDVWTHGNR